MLEHEKKMPVPDMTVFIVLFVAGDFLGKLTILGSYLMAQL